MVFKVRDNFLHLISQLLIGGLLLYMAAFFIWTLFYLETGNGDNVEHIHSTWLVANGKVPYRDFFQHHNPLLWYLFAPLIKININQIFLLDAAHAISLITGTAAFFMAYKIASRFFASKSASVLSLLILCPPYYYVFCFNYNPDTFMVLFYVIGLYYLFLYWEKERLASLVISFFSFFLAFMFTQKILIPMALLGFLSLYMFYHKKTPLNHLIYALLLPILGLFLFLAYLYRQNALDAYWKSNYIFNIVMQDYYGDNKIKVMDFRVLMLSIELAFISIFCFFTKKSYTFKLISILFIAEFLQRVFYFSIAPYYLLPLMVYICCLNSVLIDKIIRWKYFLVYPFLGIGVYYAYISAPEYRASFGNDRSFARYLNRNITPCDYVISSYLGSQSIISKDVQYYWALLGHVDVAGAEVGIAPIADLTALTLRYKPKLIYGGIYWSSYEQNRGRNVFVQRIDPQVIEEYYNQSPFGEFFILKPEYQQKECRYHPLKKEWLYVN